ncbi:MAG: diguanylate cyclase [Roseibium sp.]
MEESAAGARNYISEFVEQRNVLVQAFAENHSDLLFDMIDDPNDLGTQDRVQKLVADYFPSHFAFVARHPNGEFVPDDFGEFVGDACRADMTEYSGFLSNETNSDHGLQHSSGIYEPFIHPQPFNYHFDLTAEWSSDAGISGLLMISFPPNQLVKILKAHQMTGHSLMLLRRDVPGLIEVTANGWRENFGRDGMLTREELGSLHSRLPVEGTRWDAVYLPKAAVFADQKLKIYRLSGLAILIVGIGLAVFTWWYFYSEAVRRQYRRDNIALLQQSNRDRSTLEALIDLIPMPIFRNRSGVIELANNAYANLLGRSIEDLRGKHITDIVGPEVAEQIRVVDNDLLATPGTTKTYEQKLMSADGGGERDVIVYKTCMVGEDGEAPSTVGAVVDVTEEKALRAKLEMLAMSDPLTGIANRRKFLEGLQMELQRSSRYEHPLSVVMLDIDHFKSVNDSYGHDVGDEVIKRVAAVIEATIRDNIDLVGRVGGEEFAVLLPETSAEGAFMVAERIRENIENTLIVSGGQRLGVTTSAGTATIHAHAEIGEADQILVKADKALYRSKKAGRNQTSVFKAA